jgi:hypothetical protein
MERLSSLREALHGEKVFVDRKSSWRNSLHGENSQGEMIFQERAALKRSRVKELSHGRLWCENGTDQFLTPYTPS